MKTIWIKIQYTQTVHKAIRIPDATPQDKETSTAIQQAKNIPPSERLNGTAKGEWSFKVL